MLERMLRIGGEQVRFTIRNEQLFGTGWSGAHLLESPTRYDGLDTYPDQELARLWAWRWVRKEEPFPEANKQ